MKHPRPFLVVLAISCISSAGLTWAEEEHPEGEEHPQGEEHPMSPEDMAMMEAHREAGTIGEPHEWLAKSTGSWTVKTRWRMRPDAEEMPSEATAEREMIHGGRVLVERFSSEIMGEPFEGVAHIGYDNVTGKYWSTWMDSMSTGIGLGSGECAEDGSTCSFTLTSSDPMTGEPMTMRMVIEYPDASSEEHTFFSTHEGEEFQSMVFVYERAE